MRRSDRDPRHAFSPLLDRNKPPRPMVRMRLWGGVPALRTRALNLIAIATPVHWTGPGRRTGRRTRTMRGPPRLEPAPRCRIRPRACFVRCRHALTRGSSSKTSSDAHKNTAPP